MLLKNRPGSWRFSGKLTGLLALLFVFPFITPHASELNISTRDGEYVIGPIGEESDFEDIQAKLDASNIDYLAAEVDTTRSLGFIVVTPTFDSREAAAPTIQDLNDAGVRDYLYVGRGVYVDRISAGVFSERAAAERRADRLNDLGFDFTVIERTDTVTGIEFSIRTSDIKLDVLRRLLVGELISPAPIPQHQELPVETPAEKQAEGAQAESEPGVEAPSVVEAPVAEPPPVAETPVEIEPEPSPEVVETTIPPVTETPEVAEDTETVVEEVAEPDPARIVTRAPVVRQESQTSDSSWLWLLFAGIVLIIIGSLAYYILQRRAQADAAKIIENRPARQEPEPETAPDDDTVMRGAAAEDVADAVVQKVAETDPAAEPQDAREVIFDYAATVLSGTDSTHQQSLTILGTEDTAITDLIQDLIYITSLDKDAPPADELVFDTRSMLDNLVTRFTGEAAERNLTLQSAFADSLPASVALDAAKLDRVLSILMAYAISRSTSGLIKLSQDFAHNELITEIQFNLDVADPDAELGAITNPSLDSVGIEQRVKFGVALRLTTIMGGSLRAAADAGEATIGIHLPAQEVSGPAFTLPSGKTIDDLLHAESNAQAEISQIREETEARIHDAVRKQAEIEQEASASITALTAELEALKQYSSTNEQNLFERETDLAQLRTELDAVKEARDTDLSEQKALENQARGELEQLTEELQSARQQLQQEVASRTELEQAANARVADLETALAEAESAQEAQSASLQAKEDAARTEVAALQASLSELQQANEQYQHQLATQAETLQEIDQLKASLAAAEERLGEEAEQREAINSEASVQLVRLNQELNTARTAAAASTAEKEAAVTALSEELEQVRSEEASTREQVNSLNARLADSEAKHRSEIDEKTQREEAALHRVTNLETELSNLQSKLDASSTQQQAREEAVTAEVSTLRASLEQLQSLNLQYESRLESSAGIETEITALRRSLEGAEARLAEESRLRQQAETGAENQVRDLLKNLNEAKAAADASANETAGLTSQLDNVTSELQEARTQITNLSSEVEQVTETARLEVERLQAELNSASMALAEEQEHHAADTRAAETRVSELEARLESVEIAGQAQLQARDEEISTAQREIERLQSELKQAEGKLFEEQSSTSQSRDNARSEVQSLQADLSHAQARLEDEMTRRNRAESSAGSQIASLIDELNEARAQIQVESREKQSLEAESQGRINDIESELSAAKAQLEQATADLENERAEKAAREKEVASSVESLEHRLAELEGEQGKLKQENERAEAFGAQQSVLLEQALSEAANSAKVEKAAKKVAAHLKGRVASLEAHITKLTQTIKEQAAAEAQAKAEAETETEAKPTKSTAEESATAQDDAAAPEPSLAEQAAGQLADYETDEDFSLEDFSEDDEDHRVILEDIDEDEPQSDQPQPESTPELSLMDAAPAGSPAAKSGLSLEGKVATAPALSPVEDDKDALAPAPQPTSESSKKEEPEEEPIAAPELSLLEDNAVTSSPAEKPASKADPQAAAPTPSEGLSLAPTGDVVNEQPQQQISQQEAPPRDSAPLFSTNADDADDDGDIIEIQFDDKPIRSSRPVNNPVLHAMIERFVERLLDHIEAMEQALSQRDYLELLVSCNWVRGEANTLGYEPLIAPIENIELQLRREKFSQIITHISELRNIAERIEVKKQSLGNDAPIQFFVPEHAKNAVIYENFVAQLGTKILELEVAAQNNNTRQMTQVCRWIDRYGTKIKFVEVIEAAGRLQEALDSGDKSEIGDELKAFTDLYAKIEIVKPETVA